MRTKQPHPKRVRRDAYAVYDEMMCTESVDSNGWSDDDDVEVILHWSPHVNRMYDRYGDDVWDAVLRLEEVFRWVPMEPMGEIGVFEYEWSIGTPVKVSQSVRRYKE